MQMFKPQVINDFDKIKNKPPFEVKYNKNNFKPKKK